MRFETLFKRALPNLSSSSLQVPSLITGMRICSRLEQIGLTARPTNLIIRAANATLVAGMIGIPEEFLLKK